MATLTELTNAQVAPDQALDEDTLVIVRANIEALLLGIYGIRTVEGSTTHNHGQLGGDTLFDRHIASILCGPYCDEDDADDAAVLVGIPIDPLDGSDPVASYAVQPKLLAVSREVIKGGVTKLYVLNIITTDQINVDFDIIISIRRPEHHGYGPGTFDVSVTLNYTNTTEDMLVKEGSIDDLTILGNAALDRDVLVEVYLASDPEESDDDLNRQISTLIYAKERQGNIEGLRYISEIDRPKIQASSITAGQPVDESLTSSMKDSLNHLLSNSLGKAPGIDDRMEETDTSVPFEITVPDTHKHQGRLYINSSSKYESDGALLTHRLAGYTCAGYMGEGAGNFMDSEPFRGHLIHPDGLLNGTWLQLNTRLSIGAGASYVVVVFSLSTETEEQFTEMRIHARLTAITGATTTSILTNILSDGVDSIPETGRTAQSFRQSVVEPIDSAQYQTNAKRKALAAGLWTRAAFINEDSAPVGLRFPGHAMRQSKPVLMYFGNKAFDSSLAQRDSGDWQLQLKFSLEVGRQTGAYDETARICSLDVFNPVGQ